MFFLPSAITDLLTIRLFLNLKKMSKNPVNARKFKKVEYKDFSIKNTYKKFKK